MKVVKLSGVLATTLMMAAGCHVEGEQGPDVVQSDRSEMMMHHCDPGPVMLSGDFDGDGVITTADVGIIEAAKDAGVYASFWDTNDDGKLNGQDVAVVAKNLGDTASPRDAQMLALWNTVEPYRNIYNAIADGYIPFTPDLRGHGVHWVRLDLVFNWASRGGFDPAVPEGLNYSPTGELMAAFYYGLAITDLHNLNPGVPEGAYLAHIAAPNSFDGVDSDTWHQHTGACFGRFTGGAIPSILEDDPDAMPGLTGFNQCMTEADCNSYGEIPGVNHIWSTQFHMLHAWVVKHNECGVFGGIDPSVSLSAPHEPNHGLCTAADVASLPLYEVDPLF